MAKRFYRTDTSPDNFRALWDKIHSASEGLDVANATIRQQAATIATLQSGLTTAQRNALQALIAAGKTTTQQTTTAGQSGGSGGTSGGGGSSGGGGGSPVPPPAGTGLCTSQPLSTSLPGWFSTALIGAGQSTTSNCYDPAILAAIEADCNANDFTLQRDSGCNLRGRLYHQGNHGMWGTFCGQPDASAVADYHVDVVVTNNDGTVSWGWV